jgi:hypothetical protein
MLRRVALVRTEVPPKRRFLQQPHGLTSQKTPLFLVTAVKTSNLTEVMDLLYLNGVEDRGTMHWKIELHAKF